MRRPVRNPTAEVARHPACAGRIRVPESDFAVAQLPLPVPAPYGWEPTRPLSIETSSGAVGISKYLVGGLFLPSGTGLGARSSRVSRSERHPVACSIRAGTPGSVPAVRASRTVRGEWPMRWRGRCASATWAVRGLFDAVHRSFTTRRCCGTPCREGPNPVGALIAVDGFTTVVTGPCVCHKAPFRKGIGHIFKPIVAQSDSTIQSAA